MVIAVSQYDHYLNALLTKWHSGALSVDNVGVMSNHKACEAMTRFYELPFHHWPVSAEMDLTVSDLTTRPHARGVKVIGATAHYVTPDLDEGPIIVGGSLNRSSGHCPADGAHWT